jgi:ethanolamine ammonia-lyase large subunit
MHFGNATTCRHKHVCSRMLQIRCARWNGAPVDLVFQSIGGTEGTNRSFGVTLGARGGAGGGARAETRDGGRNVMYFETGQGARCQRVHIMGVDQQTLEARAYAWRGISSRCW